MVSMYVCWLYSLRVYGTDFLYKGVLVILSLEVLGYHLSLILSMGRLDKAGRAVAGCSLRGRV